MKQRPHARANVSSGLERLASSRVCTSLFADDPPRRAITRSTRRVRARVCVFTPFTLCAPCLQCKAKLWSRTSQTCFSLGLYSLRHPAHSSLPSILHLLIAFLSFFLRVHASIIFRLNFTWSSDGGSDRCEEGDTVDWSASRDKKKRINSGAVSTEPSWVTYCTLHAARCSE